MSHGLRYAHHYRYRNPEAYRLPDPKWLLLDNGQVLDDPHDDDEQCPDCAHYYPLRQPLTIFRGRTP